MASKFSVLCGFDGLGIAGKMKQFAKRQVAVDCRLSAVDGSGRLFPGNENG